MQSDPPIFGKPLKCSCGNASKMDLTVVDGLLKVYAVYGQFALLTDGDMQSVQCKVCNKTAHRA